MPRSAALPLDTTAAPELAPQEIGEVMTIQKALPGAAPPGSAGAADQAAPLDALLADAALGTFRRFAPDASSAKFAAALARRPQTTSRRLSSLAAELMRIGAGTSALAPARGDRRFADPAWTGNAMLRRIVQSYLAAGQTAGQLIHDAGLGPRDEKRVRFGAGNLIEAMSPSNVPLVNPSSAKAAIDTGGLSLVRGGLSLLRDLASPPRIPEMADRSAFEVGRNIAVTPGEVVLRTEVLELIQYRPQTGRVREVPLLIVPPTINKFYALDLAPGRSMVEYRSWWLIRDTPQACSMWVVSGAMIWLAVVLPPRPGRRIGYVMCMQPAAWPEPDPLIARRSAKYSGKRPRPLAVQVRDRLGQWLEDEQFAAAFGDRGRPGWSPSRLALVTILQREENLADRAAAEAVRTRIDWQYLLGLPLDDPGFDHTVLSEFRNRVADAGLEQVVLDALLTRLAAGGLVKGGGKQRTDSTHVVAAVAALNRLELAGESVRAALEALTAAHPGWVAQQICVPDFARRYGTPMTSWRPPVSQARRDELAIAYARDGYALLEAVYDSSSPGWLREIPAVDVLRRVLVQNYTRTITDEGREVVRRREKEPEGDGLPHGHIRIASPYDTDARWGVKREEFWLGYKLSLSNSLCKLGQLLSFCDITAGSFRRPGQTGTRSGNATANEFMAAFQPRVPVPRFPLSRTSPSPSMWRPVIFLIPR